MLEQQVRQAQAARRGRQAARELLEQREQALPERLGLQAQVVPPAQPERRSLGLPDRPVLREPLALRGQLEAKAARARQEPPDRAVPTGQPVRPDRQAYREPQDPPGQQAPPSQGPRVPPGCKATLDRQARQECPSLAQLARLDFKEP